MGIRGSGGSGGLERGLFGLRGSGCISALWWKEEGEGGEVTWRG